MYQLTGCSRGPAKLAAAGAMASVACRLDDGCWTHISKGGYNSTCRWCGAQDVPVLENEGTCAACFFPDNMSSWHCRGTNCRCPPPSQEPYCSPNQLFTDHGSSSPNQLLPAQLLPQPQQFHRGSFRRWWRSSRQPWQRNKLPSLCTRRSWLRSRKSSRRWKQGRQLRQPRTSSWKEWCKTCSGKIPSQNRK